MTRTVQTFAVTCSALLFATGAFAADEPQLPRSTEASRTDVVTSPIDAKKEEKPQSVEVSIEANKDGATLAYLESTGTIQGNSGYGSFSASVERWTPVCMAPCKEDVDPKGTFRIEGNGVVTSDQFRLPNENKIHLKADSGSTGVRSGGSILATLGGLALVTGGSTFLVAKLVEDPFDKGPSTVENVGLGLLIGGAVGLVGGIVMVATSGTHVTTSTGRELAQKRSPSPSLTSAGLTF